jgi:hexosaminidase
MRIVTLGWFMVSAMVLGHAKAEWNLMPQPARMTPGQGRLKVDSSFRIALSGYSEPRLERAAAPAPLAALSDVLEPVKEYAREVGRDYTQSTPLNRLVDATLPESDVAREFGNLVDRVLARGADSQASRDQLRHWLEHWRANDAALEPVLESSFLLREAIPLSKDLAAVAAAGLEALEYLVGGRKPDPEWVSRERVLLESAEKPRAELLLMIVAPVRKLVDAANAHN